MKHRAALMLVVLVCVLCAPASAAAAPATWAPAASAPIHPGVTTITGPNQCTSNFVFTDDRGRVYLGQAAHCASLGGASATDGCTTPTLPIGTSVRIQGAAHQGKLAYNSWRTMQERKETDANTCMNNDLALVAIDARDYGRVNPSVPYWGGPTGLARTTTIGENVLNFGATPLIGGNPQLKPRQGLSRGQSDGGWTHTVFTLLPGLPGDSGSGLLNESGQAFGILSTLMILPEPLSNGASDLFLTLNYANHFANLGALELVNGTEPFHPELASFDFASLDGTLTFLEQALAGLGLLG